MGEGRQIERRNRDRTKGVRETGVGESVTAAGVKTVSATAARATAILHFRPLELAVSKFGVNIVSRRSAYRYVIKPAEAKSARN